MSTRINRLFAASILVGVILTPSAARAGDCTFQITPNPGWRGATVTMQGFDLGVGVNYWVNFNGDPIQQGVTNAGGDFSFTYTVPNNAPQASGWFAYSDGCGMDDERPYTVLAQQPTTTTSSVTTTTTTTTTTTPTTTTVAPTTTEPPATTVAPATTTSVADTTTTSEADAGGGGGLSPVVWVLIGTLIALGLFGAFLLGRRRDS